MLVITVKENKDPLKPNKNVSTAYNMMKKKRKSTGLLKQINKRRTYVKPAQKRRKMKNDAIYRLRYMTEHDLINS